MVDPVFFGDPSGGILTGAGGPEPIPGDGEAPTEPQAGSHGGIAAPGACPTRGREGATGEQPTE